MAKAMVAQLTRQRSKLFMQALPDVSKSLTLKPNLGGYFLRAQIYAAVDVYASAIKDLDNAIKYA